MVNMHIWIHIKDMVYIYMYIYEPYTVPKELCRCNSELYTAGLSATAQRPAVTWLQPPLSASTKLVLLGPTLLGSLSWGLCHCIFHSLFALPVEFCSSVGFASINPRKSPSPELEHLVSKPALRMRGSPRAPRTQRGLQRAAAVNTSTALGKRGQSGCTALAGLRAIDGQSWHLHFSQRVNTSQRCFNFPAWNLYLIIQSFHDFSWPRRYVRFSIIMVVQTHQTIFFLWFHEYLKYACIYFNDEKYS